MNFYIPSNLDLEKKLTENKVDKKWLKPINKEKLYFFLHLIYEQRVLYKNKPFVNLHAAHLRKFIKNYKECRELLESLDIIECDHTYIITEKSFGYKFKDEYADSTCVLANLARSRIKKRLEAWKQNRLPKTKTHRHLYRYLQQLEIVESSELLENLSVQEYNSALISIEKIKNRDFFLYEDDYGRVHTNITTLRKSLRGCLRVNNSKVVSIDTVNSQPLVLCTLVHKYLYSQRNIYRYTIRCPLLPKLLEEFELYKKLCEDGVFYDFLMEKSLVKDRDSFKKSFFKEVYGKSTEGVFRDAFPFVADVIDEIKKKDYRRLAWMLQREESKIIYGKICFRLMTDYPDVFISTIHDSILTTEENAELVQTTMKKEFEKLGLFPKFHLE